VAVINRSLELFFVTPLIGIFFGGAALWASGADAKTIRRTIADMLIVFPQ
jgi:hypothetical protein